MSDDYKPERDAYGFPKPPDPSIWKRGVCTSYPGSTYGCGCAKCHRKFVEFIEEDDATAEAMALLRSQGFKVVKETV